MYKNIDPMNISVKNIHEFLGNMNIKEFTNVLDSEKGIMSRTSFCTFLGIKKSTLSGWLKEDKIPQYAQVAFGLFAMLRKLQSSQKAEEPMIKVKLGTEWALMKLEKDAQDKTQGRIITKGIENEMEADQLLDSIALSQAFKKRFVPLVMAHENFLSFAIPESSEDHRCDPSLGFFKPPSSPTYQEEEQIDLLVAGFIGYVNSARSGHAFDEDWKVFPEYLASLLSLSKGYLSDEEYNELVEKMAPSLAKLSIHDDYNELKELLLMVKESRDQEEN